MVVAPSVLIQHLTAAFQISPAQLGLLAGSYFYAYFLFQIPAGILIDKFGSRGTTAIGIILCSLGVLLFSQSTTLLWPHRDVF